MQFPEWMHRARSRAAVLAVLGGVVFYILAAYRLGFFLTCIVIVAPSEVWRKLRTPRSARNRRTAARLE